MKRRARQKGLKPPPPPIKRRKLITAKEFELLQDLPKRKILELVIEHNLVQKRRTKPTPPRGFERAIALAARSVRVKIVPRKTESGGFYFCTRQRGERPISTGIPIDIRPLPTAQQVKSDPDWWQASKHIHEIQKKKREIERSLHSGYLRKLALESKPLHVAVLRKALNRAGFAESLFVERLEDELGAQLLGQICRDFYSFVDREAERYIQAKRVKLGDKIVILNFGRPLTGEFRIQPIWDEGTKALAKPLNSPGRRKQNANTKMQ